jgi:hypothetical protein
MTKDLYVAWSAGTTGAGKGIRFKKATYSSGSWTWGAEREIDNSRYVLDSYRFLQCRFDATNNCVVFGGQLYTGSFRDEVLYIRDAADTATTTIPLDLHHDSSVDGIVRPGGSGSIAIDGQGNVYIFGVSSHNGAVSGYPIVYHKWSKSTGSLSGVVTTDAATAGNGQSYVTAYYNAATKNIDLIYTVGNNSPYAVKYDYIATTTDDTDNKINRWGIIPI